MFVLSGVGEPCLCGSQRERSDDLCRWTLAVSAWAHDMIRTDPHPFYRGLRSCLAALGQSYSNGRLSVK